MVALFNIIFILAGIGLFKIVIKRYSYSLNHVSLFSSIWVFVVVGAQFSSLGQLNLGTISVLYLSWYSFLIGSFILEGNQKSYVEKIVVLKAERLKLICYLLVALSLVANLDLLQNVLFNFTSFEVWAEMRKENVFADYRNENAFYTLFGTNAVIYIPLAIYLYKEKIFNKKKLTIIMGIGYLLAVLAFTRAPILQLMIISIVSYSFLFGYKKFPIKILFISGIILLAVFIASSFFIRNSSASFSVLMTDVELYLFGGVLAYQTILQGDYFQPALFANQYYSLDFVNYLSKKIGFINSYPNLVREYDHNILTNVYTYLDAFTLDFGFFGAILGSFLIGFFCKIIYLSYRRSPNVIYLIVYSTMCYFCVFSFVNNEFIRTTLILLFFKLFLINLFLKVTWKFSTNQIR